MTNDETIASGTARRNLTRRLPGPVRWIISGTFLLLLPKCLACVAGYVALIAGLGRAGQDLCGGSEDGVGDWTADGTQLLSLGVVAAPWLFRLVALQARRLGWRRDHQSRELPFANLAGRGTDGPASIRELPSRGWILREGCPEQAG